MERSRVREKIKEEFLAVLPPTLFFFVALHLVAFIRVLMAEAHGIHVTSTVSIAVAALIGTNAPTYMSALSPPVPCQTP